ncbi:MAG: class I SAM-dependent methyltransferase [Kiritimatiellae bacterium]|nr:class I SAM-dependent methyltransferase [Kiritimatiellia bacterium]MDW8458333.1 class I SAM-dependent methyltransferase [Verrucomicrobiota bacterium]
MASQTFSSGPELADVETASASYAARFAGDVGRWMLERQERLVLEALQRAGARSVLDVGGGHGQLARPLADAGYDVTVLGSESICAARIADLVQSNRCRFVVGSVIALPFADRSFDAVVTVRLLAHCERWRMLIRECARVARRVVIVDYPVAGGFNLLAPFLFEAKKKIEQNTRRWRNFRHGEVAEAFRQFGFEPERRTGQFFWPMGLHRAIGRLGVSKALEWAPERLGVSARFGTPVIAAYRRTDRRGDGFGLEAGFTGA